MKKISLFLLALVTPALSMAAPVSFSGLSTVFSIDAGTMTVLYDDTAVRLSTGIITVNLAAEAATRLAADQAIGVTTAAIAAVKLSTTGGTMTGALTMANAGIVMTGINATIVTSSDVTGAKFIGSGAGLTAASVPAAAIAAGSLGASVVASSIAANTVLPSKVAAGTYTTITLPAANVAAGALGSQVIASSIALASVQDGSIVGMTASKLSGALPAISGASLTTLTAANIAAGSLPADVIVSSYALAIIPDDAIIGVAASKVAAGSLGASVKAVYLVPKILAAAAVDAEVPLSIGQQFTVTDAVAPYSVCFATSTEAGGIVLSGTGAHCQ